MHCEPCPVHAQSGRRLLCKANYSNGACSRGAAGSRIRMAVVVPHGRGGAAALLCTQKLRMGPARGSNGADPQACCTSTFAPSTGAG